MLKVYKLYFYFTLHSYSQDQTGFQLITSSFTSGRISCSFTRSVLADNLAEDRNLNESAFVLLAFGSQRGNIIHTDLTLIASCSLVVCYTLITLFVTVYKMMMSICCRWP